MAKNDNLWLVTHRVTAERITPKKEESSFASIVGAVFVIFVVLAIIGALAGHSP
jgi:hypothetical protein